MKWKRKEKKCVSTVTIKLLREHSAIFFFKAEYTLVSAETECGRVLK